MQGTSLEFKSLLSAAARCPSNKLAFEKWRGTLQTSPLHEVLSRTTRTLKGFTRFTISESFGQLVQILKKNPWPVPFCMIKWLVKKGTNDKYVAWHLLRCYVFLKYTKCVYIRYIYKYFKMHTYIYIYIHTLYILHYYILLTESMGQTQNFRMTEDRWNLNCKLPPQ